jgi:AraC-like DNA-binding protein
MENYFRYLPETRDATLWGVAVTAAGFTRIPPRKPYPPVRHPVGHHFDWSHGRVLEALQIVLLTDGRGWFETRATGLRTVETGTAFALLPGVWHRYRPDPETGWEESWIEVRGPVVDAMRRARLLSADNAVRHMAMATWLDAKLEAVHTRIREARPGFDPELSARALSVLAAWHEAGRARTAPSPIVRAVAEAERRLAEHLAEPTKIPVLAKQLGVAYSHFRRVFKRHTGFAPWQYVLHLRLAQARRLLASRDITLDELAAQLGFSSAFHLSVAFKRAYGVPPDHWRRQYAWIHADRPSKATKHWS